MLSYPTATLLSTAHLQAAPYYPFFTGGTTTVGATLELLEFEAASNSEVYFGTIIVER